MLQIQSFTFNPFSENTYLVWDSETKDCAIFDPGCSDFQEEQIVETFLQDNSLKLTQLINTHCHIDHVIGNKFIAEKFNLKLQASQIEESILQWSESASLLYQIPYDKSPLIEIFLSEKDTIKIGNQTLEILFTPGHSPGSLTFVNHQESWALVGDVIFRQSIGRTDLKGGSYDELENSIRTQIYTLPDNYTLHSGHGPETQVGFEKKNNGFVRM